MSVNAKVSNMLHTATPIRGILIEGVDYAGKTTLAKYLVDYCSGIGRRVRYGKEFICTTLEISSAIEAAGTLNLGFQQDMIFAQATILDLRSYTHNDDIILIQDRHWISIFGHLSFFYGSEAAAICESLLLAHHPFVCQVYLTSNRESKQARIAACPPRSQLDSLLAKDPELHQRYDDHIRQLLPKNEAWNVLDTTERSVIDVAQKVIEDFELRLEDHS